ncbi:unnamed protein product [Trichobilharzia regenti]|nr:unnamed protein product [Trichobilharzia regenti]
MSFVTAVSSPVVENRPSKHRSGWQRALKRTQIHLTTVPVIMNTNCCSLPNKIMYLQSLMSTDTYHNTAIITLQETWLHELYDDNRISLQDFILFRQDRQCCHKKNGGGVATFIHSKWSISNNVCFSFSNDFTDCITVKCRPKHLPKYKHIFVTNILLTPVNESYSSDNLLNLRCMLKNTNWDLFYESTLDETIANITDYLKFYLDICCPKQTLFKHLDRFLSLCLKQLRRQKETLYKPKDKLGLKKINAQIKSEIKNPNAIYNQTLLSCKSPNSMWKFFNEITGNIKRINVLPSYGVNALNHISPALNVKVNKFNQERGNACGASFRSRTETSLLDHIFTPELLKCASFPHSTHNKNPTHTHTHFFPLELLY